MSFIEYSPPSFNKSVHLEHWPSFNAEALKEDSYELVIQVNGKVRDKVNINNDMSEDQIKELTLKRPNILKWTQDKEIRKITVSYTHLTLPTSAIV